MSLQASANEPQPVSKPSLRGAKLRVNRANEHIKEIERWLDLFRQENSTRPVSVQVNPDTGENILLKGKTPLPTKRVNIIAGETLYNLRAALDYLVFALAWLDTGQPPFGPQDRTQFPIEDEPRRVGKRKGFAEKKGALLKGLTREHIAAIERLQPYKGGNWTAVLRDLSNPDKHRALTAVQAVYVGRMHVSSPDPHTNPTGPKEVKVEPDFTVKVEFWDGAPVVETLRILQSQVAQVIQSFEADFGESGTAP